MLLIKRIQNTVLKFVPTIYKSETEKLLVYADINKTVTEFLGKKVIATLIATILVFIILYFINIAVAYKVLIILAILTVPLLLGILLLYFKAESRKQEVEHALPDALQIMSANLQAGMTPFDAIRAAAEKDIGPLSKLLKEATTKALGSYEFSGELVKIGTKFNSTMLKRSLRLIANSLSSGSKLANLLDDLSEDISQTESLKKEMVTNTKTYTMFIMFTIIFGTPLLLAISIHFVTMVEDIQSGTDLSSDQFGLGFMTGELTITPDFLTKLSFVILMTTAILSSMLTGVITTGKAKSGLKLAPVIAGASIVMFYLSKAGIGFMFG